MKNGCIVASKRSFGTVGKFLAALTASASLLAISAFAQVTPLSVGSTGVGPLPFTSQPMLSDGWSTLTIAGDHFGVTNITQMDTAVQTNDIAAIITPLGSSATVNPAPSGNAIARWNSVNLNVQTRPTGNAYIDLLLTLQNDSGGDKTAITLDYDFGAPLPAGTTEGEDEGLAGHRVYYSLTGRPNSWVHIPEFDGGLSTVGPKHVALNLASAWESGAKLYILWIDDNGVVGGTGSTGAVEAPYTIDNFALGFGGPPQPPTITVQPHNVATEQCRDTNLTVTATGTAPLHYQWFHATTPVGTDSSTLPLVNPQTSDSGSYHVHVSNSAGSADSSTVTVTVNADTTAPTISSATARVNGTNIVVTYSERMDPASATNVTAYHLHPVSGGANLEPDSATLSTDARTVTLTFGTPRTANANYQLLIDTTVGDACVHLPVSGPANGVGQIIAPLKYEVYLMTFENQAWKYKADYVDPLTDWRLDPSFDDSAWLNGVSVLDGKQETTGFTPTPRTTVGATGMAVTTQLPLRDPPGTTTTNIPCYYFRGHFTVPVPLSEVSGLELRTYVDDFDVSWMNNYNVPVRRNPGNPLTDLDTFGYSGGTSVGDAGVLGPFSIDPTNLVAGDNLVCAKVFQQAVGSSDVTFAYELIAVVNSFPAAGPSLAISQSGGTVTITWSDPAATLYQASSVDATGGAWTAVSGAGLSPGQYQFNAGSTAGAKFYTLRR